MVVVDEFRARKVVNSKRMTALFGGMPGVPDYVSRGLSRRLLLCVKGALTGNDIVDMRPEYMLFVSFVFSASAY